MAQSKESKQQIAHDITEIIFVVDASGSMCGMESDTIGGINSVLRENRKLGGAANVSIVQFANESHVIVDRKDIHKVRDLTPRDYRAGGCTALYDALGGAIHHTQMIQDNMPHGFKATHVLFVVITDGLENASRRYSCSQVKHLVETQKEQGWEFLFLGANIDAVEEATHMGIEADHASGYVSDSTGTGIAYDAVGRALCAMRAYGSVPSDWKDETAADERSRGRHARAR